MLLRPAVVFLSERDSVFAKAVPVRYFKPFQACFLVCPRPRPEERQPQAQSSIRLSQDQRGVILAPGLFHSYPETPKDRAGSLKAVSEDRVLLMSRRRPVTRIVGGYRVSCVELEDSGPEFRDGDVKTLRQRLEDFGYVYLKGVLDPDKVLRARAAILARLQELGVLDPSAESVDRGAILPPEGKGSRGWHIGFTVDAESGGVTGDEAQSQESVKAWSKIGNSEAVTEVYGKEVSRVFQTMFGEDISPHPENTW